MNGWTISSSLGGVGHLDLVQFSFLMGVQPNQIFSKTVKRKIKVVELLFSQLKELFQFIIISPSIGAVFAQVINILSDIC